MDRLSVRDGRVSRSPGGRGGYCRRSALGALHGTLPPGPSSLPLYHSPSVCAQSRLLAGFFFSATLVIVSQFCFDVSLCVVFLLAESLPFWSLSPFYPLLCVRSVFFASVPDAPPWRFV